MCRHLDVWLWAVINRRKACSSSKTWRWWNTSLNHRSFYQYTFVFVNINLELDGNFNNITAKGITFDADIVQNNIAVIVWAVEHAVEEVLSLISNHCSQVVGLKPNVQVFSALIGRAARRLDYIYLKTILKSMSSMGVWPNEIIIRQLEFVAQYPPNYDQVSKCTSCRRLTFVFSMLY